MKSFLTLIIVNLATFLAFCQPHLQWEHTYTRGNSSDRGNAIILDKSNNVLITGYSLTPSTNKDILVIKYNPVTGDTLWTRSYDGVFHGVDEGITLKTDEYNNVYVSGKTQRNGTTTDIVTIKYDSLGNRLWVSVHNGNSPNRDDVGLDLEIDQLGNVYIVGRSNFNGIIIKCNPSGGELWSKAVFDAEKVEFNNDGNIMTISGDDAKIHVFNSAGTIISSFNSIGNITTQGINLTTSNIFIHGVEFSSNLPKAVGVYKFTYGNPDGIMVGGWNVFSCGSCTLNGAGFGIDLDQNSFSVMSYYDGSDYNFFISKRNPNGDTLWTRQFGNEELNEIPVSVSLNRNIKDPDVYVTGYTSASDIITLKYDAFGNLIWQTTYDCGNSMNDVASQMVRDANNNLYITGYSNCSGNNDDVKTLKYCVDAPTKPSAIVGNTAPCYTTSQQYSVTLDTSVESYTWILPQGWIGTSTSNIIQVTAGQSGTITVVANGKNCSSEPQVLTITVNTIPSHPGPIQGDISLCSGSSQNYSIANVPGATSYVWNLPSGWTGTSNSNMISTVSGITSGSISVAAVNVCGTSTHQTLFVTVTETPSAPIEIIGAVSLCPGQASTYSVLHIQGATDYLWALPPGWFTPDNTGTSINIIPGDDGTLSVVSTNGECHSAPTSIDVSVESLPSPLGSINGRNSICKGQQELYFIDNAGSGVTYYWTLPNGSSVETLTSSLVIQGDTSGIVEVFAANQCGESNTISKEITVREAKPDVPVLDTGDLEVCKDSTTQLRLINQSATDSIRWTLAVGISGTSTTEDISLSVSSSGTIYAYAINACGISNGLSIPVTVVEIDPTVITGDLSLEANEIDAEYQWIDCSNMSEIPGETNKIFQPAFDGNYQVRITKNGCTEFSECYLFMKTSSVDFQESGISIFPNPFYQSFIIKDVEGTFTQVRLLDMLGKQMNVILQRNDSSITINAADLPSGVYYIQISDQLKRITTQIVKL